MLRQHGYHMKEDDLSTSNDVLVVEYCPIKEQVADVQTKGFSREKHVKFTHMMGLMVD